MGQESNKNKTRRDGKRKKEEMEEWEGKKKTGKQGKKLLLSVEKTELSQNSLRLVSEKVIQSSLKESSFSFAGIKEFQTNGRTIEKSGRREREKRERRKSKSAARIS